MTRFVTQADSEEIIAAARALRRGTTELYRRLRSERMSHGLSPTKLSVLGRLALSGPLTVTVLASQERVQPQSLTRTLADLEESKLIVRRQNQVDRRQSLTEITQLGEDLLKNDARSQATWLALAMSSVLTPAERELLRVAGQLMRQLAEADVSRELNPAEAGG
ncbi:MAG: MarR family transcriptional regulator [Verrucomicrobia bacterium]|nr:MarR family transcriptional regulator [Verrucomicrobiota bacterium]